MSLHSDLCVCALLLRSIFLWSESIAFGDTDTTFAVQLNVCPCHHMAQSVCTSSLYAANKKVVIGPQTRRQQVGKRHTARVG